MLIYDYIIIGGGISALYFAYKIKQFNKNITFIILEKNRVIGGRVGTFKFYNENISIGAGIIRKNKDFLLIELIKDLKIKMKEFEVNFNYSNIMKNKVDIEILMNILKKNYNNERETFKFFAKKILGEQKYQDFVISSGYSDFINSDMYDVLYNYGMDDNKCCYEGYSVVWEEVIKKLAEKVGISNIKTSINVLSIKKIIHDGIEVFKVNSINKDFIGKNIIIASPINTIKNLLPKFSIYNNIHGQPFIRIYGKFNKESSLILKKIIKTTVIVSSLLQKIIPINSEKGIYMIAYSDNKNAIKLNIYSKNTKENRKNLCLIIEKSLDLPNNSLQLLSIKSFFWNIGTHYNNPLSIKFKNHDEFFNKILSPTNNIFVIGEAVAKNQGWIEGALETVNKVINLIKN